MTNDWDKFKEWEHAVVTDYGYRQEKLVIESPPRQSEHGDWIWTPHSYETFASRCELL